MLMLKNFFHCHCHCHTSTVTRSHSCSEKNYAVLYIASISSIRQMFRTCPSSVEITLEHGSNRST